MRPPRSQTWRASSPISSQRPPPRPAFRSHPPRSSRGRGIIGQAGVTLYTVVANKDGAARGERRGGVSCRPRLQRTALRAWADGGMSDNARPPALYGLTTVVRIRTARDAAPGPRAGRRQAPRVRRHRSATCSRAMPAPATPSRWPRPAPTAGPSRSNYNYAACPGRRRDLRRLGADHRARRHGGKNSSPRASRTHAYLPHHERSNQVNGYRDPPRRAKPAAARSARRRPDSSSNTGGARRLHGARFDARRRWCAT